MLSGVVCGVSELRILVVVVSVAIVIGASVVGVVGEVILEGVSVTWEKH